MTAETKPCQVQLLTSEGITLRCRRPGELWLESGCIHEHIEGSVVCPVCLEDLVGGLLMCITCHEIDGHLCRVTEVFRCPVEQSSLRVQMRLADLLDEVSTRRR